MSLVPIPLPFSNTFAHPNDPLPQHLERVAERAAASIAPAAKTEIRAIAYVAGLFHDVGKATPWFQDYLLHGGRKSQLTHHAELGAILVWWYSAELNWPLWQRLAVFIAVRRHHGALTFQAWPELLEQMRLEFRDSKTLLRQQLAALDLVGIQQWLVEVTSQHSELNLNSSPKTLNQTNIEASLYDRQCGGSKLRRAFETLNNALSTLAGFGALLAVDKTDAALQGKYIARQTLPANAVTVHKTSVGINAKPSLLNQQRDQIATTVTQTWLAHLDQTLLTLTAPTGSGKTLTILHAALQVRSSLEARHGGLPRIIYCLPFTSVIDQNHAVFRSVLRDNKLPEREDLLLKHHHLTDNLFRSEEAEYQADGAGQLLTETWQSELVITTFHQLLHTLLSPRNANLKRAGQLTGALVLLDEVQALPLRYWETLRQLFLAAAQTFATRFVLLTATRPLIFQPGDAVELLPNYEQHFCTLSRTRLYAHHRAPLMLPAFAEQLITQLQQTQQPTLIIVNRRATVQTLFATLQQAGLKRPLIALSANLTPLDRRARIRLIQRLLRQGQPVIVVTTQLVEAGVDFSFPVVHRELAPLDSIIQAAGRCNRNNENNAVPGAVHLWQLQATKTDGSAGENLWQRVYDSALIEVTQETLGTTQAWAEAEFLGLANKYFHACKQRQDQKRIDTQLVQGDFISIEREFKLIEEQPTVALFVIRTSKDRSIWNQYRAIQDDLKLSPTQQEKLFQKFKRAFYERVIQVYIATPSGIDRNTVNSLDAGPDTYNREVGFIALPKEMSICCF